MNRQIVLELLQKLQNGDQAAEAELVQMTNEQYGELLREWRDEKWRAWLRGPTGSLFGEPAPALPPTAQLSDEDEVPPVAASSNRSAGLFASQSGGAFVHPANRKTRRSDQR